MKNFEDLKQELIDLERANPNNYELGQRVRDMVWAWRKELEENPNQVKINFKEDGFKSN